MKKTDVLWKGIMVALFLFLSVPFGALAQNITVRGTVTDNTGLPLPGVSIVIEGTNRGVITDVDGNYQIEAPSDANIIFNFLGFSLHRELVNNRTTIDVSMKEDIMSLDEVVVVGYGQMKRSDVTGSMVSVASDAIEKSVPTSIDQVLQGRAAGVQVQQNSGTPGGSSSIRIRGINSLSASNEPIFVIDGVVIDAATGSGSDNALASINPSDIVSMDILKDASATAIYGSRGANGVIIITTKRGKAGEARVTYDGYVGVQEMPSKLDLLNLRQYAQHKNDRADAGLVPHDNYFINPELFGEGTDWQDELFQSAVMQSHNLSVSGGNEKSIYSLGLGYLNQEGIAIGSGFERINLRGNFESQVKDWLKAGVNFALSNSKQNLTVEGQSLIKIAMKQTPNVAVRNADGTFDGPDTDMYVQTNPVGLAMLRENENEKMGIRSSVFLEGSFIDGLTLRTELSSDFGINNTYKFNPSYSFGAITNETIQSDRSKSYSKYWSWRNILTYNKILANVHSVTFMLGQEMQDSKWEYLRGYRSGFLNNSAHDLNAGDGTTAEANGSSGEHALLSYFGRLFYSFNDKYLLTTTLRRDGSSNFGDGNRWGWFPSAAIAWRISNEPFMQNNPVINNLKLRLGWGAVGNQNASAYAYTSVLSSVTTVWGTGQLTGNMANPDLQWETTQSSNIGLDLNLFQNRVELIADAYYKQTDNLLLMLPLPAYVGSEGQGSTSAPWANIGALENKGVEVTLNTVNVDRGGFQWRTNVVFSLNRNKVKELDTESSTIDKTIQEGSETTIVTRTAVGEPIGQFYGYKIIGRFNEATDFYYKDADGVIQEVARPEGLGISQTGVWIGDYIFKDMNEDGVINEDDRTYIGNPEPEFTYGLGNSFSFKGFDLSVNLSGSYGNDIINYQRRWLENPRENHNLLTSALGYARIDVIDPAGPDDDYRNLHVVGGDSHMYRLSASSSNANNRMSDRYVEDGSFIRIQNISIGYNLPLKWISMIGLTNAKVYANLQNVYTWTKYSGYDPEVGSYNQDALMSGIDNARYPSPRIYTFGVNLTF
ncbi:SusC/RagA family TonB-linked outer membrane protein [Geofilum sp. OHC36d9]|uniref:SusC/RagA family TonB-linked outer membrane protein n=1 Tax=Geofilum sp. OHC36d9 TaxID=3458413 RepID=UPI004033B262